MDKINFNDISTSDFNLRIEQILKYIIQISQGDYPFFFLTIEDVIDDCVIDQISNGKLLDFLTKYNSELVNEEKFLSQRGYPLLIEVSHRRGYQLYCTSDDEDFGENPISLSFNEMKKFIELIHNYMIDQAKGNISMYESVDIKPAKY